MSNTKISQISAYGIGRRKTSIASVYLIPISSKSNLESKTNFEVNELKGNLYFQYNFHYLKEIQSPMLKLDIMNQYKIIAKVKGGGLTGQADAIKLALARALCKIDNKNFRSILKAEGVLSRDSRIKERRKYGLKKARKASQYSKR